MPNEVQLFLKNPDNKTHLYSLIVDHLLMVSNDQWSNEITGSYKHTLKCKSAGVKDTFNWIEDTHEEPNPDSHH